MTCCTCQTTSVACLLKSVEHVSCRFINHENLNFNFSAHPQNLSTMVVAKTVTRESFDDIYLDLSKQPGKCRLAESGLGWKPSGGTSFTVDKAEFQSAQWSRAARGYELKIYSRNHGVVQLDGFKNEVRAPSAWT